ncbi:MAG: PD40 domain-containing protein, partial [Planctomycetales bacterium]|nr:PD40 domain-containing protein [Planctomycetales bacterium]
TDARADTRILFESYLDSNWEICSMKPDGSDRQNITRTPDVHELYPKVSNDGTKIAFLVDEHNGRRISRSLYVMNADGSDRKLISEMARHACWSPDGKKLAFAKQEFNRFNVKDYVTKSIYFYDLESGKTTQHSNEKIEHLYVPTWSHDGKWIVCTVHGGMGFGHAIVAIEVHGDRVIDLKVSGCRPNLSRDGSRLTWSGDDHTINVAEVDYTGDGPTLANVRPLYKHEKMHLYHPDLSPDAQFITFSLGPGGRVPANGPGTQTEVAEMTGVRGMWDIYIRKIDSDEEPKRLTNDPELSNKESEWAVFN